MTPKRLSMENSRREWLFLRDLTVHPMVQRAFRPHWGAKLVAEFDPNAFGELYVFKDEKADHWIWDGQHRHHAAINVLGRDQQVPCRVYSITGMSEKEVITWLSEHSLKLNDQLSWPPIDKFPIRVHAGEWRATAIHGALHQLGLRVHPTRGDGIVRAVAACDWIMDKGGQPVFARVIHILNTAWGKDQDAYHNALLRGVGLLCIHYDSKVDDKYLAACLTKSGGPTRMWGRARDYAKLAGRSVPQAAAEVMVNEYNKGRRTKRLPAWS